MIIATNVNKSFGKLKVLDNVSLTLNKGQAISLIGPNGSGKTTFIKCLLGMVVPDAGFITFNQQNILKDWRYRSQIGYMPQIGRYPDNMTIGQTLDMMKDIRKGMNNVTDDELYCAFSLDKIQGKKMRTLSGGTRQKVSATLAFLFSPDVLILDEVLAVGDEAFQRKCNDYFMERKASGKTTILVTHDMGAVKKYCNRAVLIENGLVKAIGNPENVANQYSFDNSVPIHVEVEDSESTIEPERIIVDHFQLNLLTPQQITPGDPIRFNIEFNVLEDVETYVALSLTDIDRNIWIYNDNSMDQLVHGIGHKKVYYECSLPAVNNLKLKLEVTVRDKTGKMLAFSDATQTPIIMVNRTDIANDDVSALDSASGLLQRNGQWKFL